MALVLTYKTGTFRCSWHSSQPDLRSRTDRGTASQKDYRMTDLKLLSYNPNLQSNGVSHHTDEFESTKDIIARRGQPVKITLRFNRPLQSTETFLFNASIGPQPSESNGTKVKIELSSSATSGSWSAVREASTTNVVNVNISSPANAIVGRYKVTISISSQGIVFSHRLMDCIMLFNAWVKDDSVYLPDEAKRVEYVLSESGIIYYGNDKNISQMGWNFGQFEPDVLTATLALMDKNSTTDYALRREPVHISRVYSALINSQNDNGVIEGNWSGKYSDAENPSRWNGSVEILRKWLASGPVRYGQCWVFAGVMCTVMRCLGMPTRVVTNFSSAHDTNANLSIDVYYDKDGNYLGGDDSVWNFHVWNECWFKRKDLGAACDGWQVLDATPQEESAGKFQLGPTSVNAIKNGDIHFDYDGTFVLSEMNGDHITWVYDSNSGESEVAYTDTKEIGKFTSTKAVGRNAREDVTNNYKYPEGTPEERQSYEKAQRVLFAPAFSSFAAADTGSSIAARRPAADEQPAQEVTGKFKDIPPPVVGQDINLTLSLTNKTSAAKAVKVNINAAATTYTRRTMNQFMNTSQSITLGGNEEKNIAVAIPYSLYQPALMSDKVIEVTALCQIGQGGKVLVTDNINLKNPSVDIKVVGPVVVNQKAKVEVSFSNPLNEELKNCEMLVAGSGLFPKNLVHKLSMKPKQAMTIPIEFTPYRKGPRQIQITIKCSNSLNFKGFQSITVAAAS